MFAQGLSRATVSLMFVVTPLLAGMIIGSALLMPVPSWPSYLRELL